MTVSGPLFPPSALSLSERYYTVQFSLKRLSPVQHSCGAVPVGVADNTQVVSGLFNPSNEQVHVLARLPGEDDSRLFWGQLLRHDDVLGDPLPWSGRLHSHVRVFVNVSVPYELDVVETVPRDGLDFIEGLAVEGDILCNGYESSLSRHQTDRAEHIWTGDRVVGLTVPGVHPQRDFGQEGRGGCSSSSCGGGCRRCLKRKYSLRTLSDIRTVVVVVVVV